MSSSFKVAVVNVAQEVPHEHALRLASMQVQVVKSSGTRSDLVGIEAMCVLSGLRDEPAIMPAAQAIKYVNIVTGKVAYSRNNGTGMPDKRPKSFQN